MWYDLIYELARDRLLRGGREERLVAAIGRMRILVRAGQMTAALPTAKFCRRAKGRKVRAPEDRVLGNAQSWQQEGKCHRKQTACLTLHMSGR